MRNSGKAGDGQVRGLLTSRTRASVVGNDAVVSLTLEIISYLQAGAARTCPAE